MLLFLMLMTGFAGFVDSAAGGGGLISLPAYLFAGLPVHYTYGTNKFSAACGTTFATAQFFQKGAMNIRVGLLAAVGSFVGSALGSHIVLLLSDQVLRTMMLIILPVAAVLIGLCDGVVSMFFSPTLAKMIATLAVAMVLVLRPNGLFGKAAR